MGTRRVTAFAVIAAGLLTGGLLAGCSGKPDAASTNGLASGASGSAAPSGSTNATPRPGASPSTATPTGTNPITVPSFPQRSFSGQGSQTLVGDLEDGVEPNCVLLRTTSNKLYQLVGGDRSKLKGATKHVTVDGQEIPGMATTCQQGIPFLVTNIH